MMPRLRWNLDGLRASCPINAVLAISPKPTVGVAPDLPRLHARFMKSDGAQHGLIDPMKPSGLHDALLRLGMRGCRQQHQQRKAGTDKRAAVLPPDFSGQVARGVTAGHEAHEAQPHTPAEDSAGGPGVRNFKTLEARCAANTLCPTLQTHVGSADRSAHEVHVLQRRAFNKCIAAEIAQYRKLVCGDDAHGRVYVGAGGCRLHRGSIQIEIAQPEVPAVEGLGSRRGEGGVVVFHAFRFS